MAAIASGMLGSIAATRSPFLTPSARIAAAGARPARAVRPMTGAARPCLRRGTRSRRTARTSQAGFRRSSASRPERTRRPASCRRRPARARRAVADDAAEIPDQVPEAGAVARPTSDADRHSRQASGRRAATRPAAKAVSGASRTRTATETRAVRCCRSCILPCATRAHSYRVHRAAKLLRENRRHIPKNAIAQVTLA